MGLHRFDADISSFGSFRFSKNRTEGSAGRQLRNEFPDQLATKYLFTVSDPRVSVSPCGSGND